MTKRWFNFLSAPGSRRDSEEGQALIETVLSVPLLLIVLLAGTEFARATYAAIEVSNAAKAAAQYAAMNGGATVDTGGIQAAAQNDSPNLANAVTATLSSDTCVCSGAESTTVTCNPTSGPVCATGRVMETVTVTTQATFRPLMHWGNVIPMSLTLHGYAKEMVLP